MDVRNTIALAQVDEIWLRAWVNEGIITPEQFEAETRRRALEKSDAGLAAAVETNTQPSE